eukprot:365052-Chlamydomonas_euryale.AAC.7
MPLTAPDTPSTRPKSTSCIATLRPMTRPPSSAVPGVKLPSTESLAADSSGCTGAAAGAG